MPRIAPRPIESLAPEHRAALESAVARGRVNDPRVILMTAHSDRALAQVMAALPNFPHMGNDASFGADLCEMLRLKSAQLGGCDSCQSARYNDNSEELACAILNPESLGKREQLALRLLTMMHTDHHAIDRAFFTELAEVFTPGEIMELGNMVAGMVGQHRWIHALDLYSEEPPVCGDTRSEQVAAAN